MMTPRPSPTLSSSPSPHHTLDHRTLYRLPWSAADNVIAWLEPTAKCNLSCEGCYRENVAEHKSLAQVQADLDLFRRQRVFDGVSIAGGDPLMHPEIVEIVRLVATQGWKPILNTNGLAMTRELLVELKRAGLVGLTFHVDSKQGRPGWRGKTEIETNELRQQYADLVADVGGVSCAFNSTVYQDTLDSVPDLVAWAQRNIDKVHVMVFIAYREAIVGEFDYYQGTKKVDVSAIQYVADERRQRTDITSPEMVAKVRERFPDFAPAAYLGGTEKADSFKWLLCGRVGTKEQILGYPGGRMMEAVQTINHLVNGRYLAYAPPGMLGMGRSALALGATIDPGARKGLGNYLRWIAGRPTRALEQLHYQSIMFIQPIDILPDGRQNMCDACPDITVHDGELVWSCRLEEQRGYGCFLRTVPKTGAQLKPLPCG